MKHSSKLTPFMAATILLFVPMFTLATMINVPDDYETIQAAIDASDDGDTVLVEAGTYTENINFNGKNILIIGDPDNPANVVIDGNENGSVVIFENGETESAQLKGFTIQNGSGTRDVYHDTALAGGGICCNESDPTISDCIISSNNVLTDEQGLLVYGGGIFGYRSSIHLLNSTVTDNTVLNTYGVSERGNGGGIAFYGGNSLVMNSNVSGNNAGGGIGGGIYTNSAAVSLQNSIINSNIPGGVVGGFHIVNCQFNGNANYGISVENSSLSIHDSEIIGNTNANGIEANWCNGVLIENCDIQNNGKSGIDLYDTEDIEIIKTVIANNNAGVDCRNSDPTLDRCIIAYNEDEGIYCDHNCDVTFTNGIIYGNDTRDDDSYAEIVFNGDNDPNSLVISYSDLEGGEGDIITNDNGEIFWGEGNIDADPLFVDPDNGDFHLTEDSPCIDAGDPNSELDPDGTRADMGPYYYFRTVQKPIPRNKYVMLGIPCYVVDGDASVLFRDDFGDREPGYPRWRVSRYNAANGWYERHGEGAHQNIPDFAPGLGFWIAQSVCNCILDIEHDHISGFVARDGSFNIQIDRDPVGALRGLTQIANPFYDTYDWSQTNINHSESGTVPIATAAGNGWMDGHFYTWDPEQGAEGAYIVYEFDGNEPRSLVVWQGGWVESYLEDFDLIVSFSDHGVGGMPHRPGGEDGSPDRDDDEGWALQLGLQSVDGNYLDTDNRAAIHPVSKDGWDLYDAREFTPMSSSYVHLYFDHEAREFRPGKYTWDYRSMDFDDEQVWEFTVKVVNLPDCEFILSCPNISEIDYHYFFRLENEDGERLCDMREAEEYSFRSGGADTEEINFRLVVTHYPHFVGGESDPIASEFGIISVNPNPFNAVTSITYAVPSDVYAKLAIFDISGRMVGMVVDGDVSAGNHVCEFDGSDLAAGLYFVRLEVGGDVLTRKAVVVK